MFYDTKRPQGKGGFVVQDVVFRNITSSGHKTNGCFNCTKASPCSGMVLEDVSFGGDSNWKCNKHDTDCDCFTGATGTTTHVAPDISQCLGKE